MIGKERRMAYEALVLQGLWLIMRVLIKIHNSQPNQLGGKITYAGNSERDWRGHALMYMDANGIQSEEAKAYRRDVSFPDVHQ